MPPSDAELVRGCLAGDPAAIRGVVERFQGDVFGLCVRMLRHAHDAEDASQEVFLRVFRSLKRWDNTRPLRPWVLGIAVNRCRTRLARSGNRPTLVEDLSDAPAREPPRGDEAEVAAAIRVAVDSPAGRLQGRVRPLPRTGPLLRGDRRNDRPARAGPRPERQYGRVAGGTCR